MLDIRKRFIDVYCKALESSTAALFAGAGLSCGSGFVSWKELLRNLASSVGLDIDKETDLITVAQYYKNENQGRNAINEEILRSFVKHAEPNKLLKIITSLPIKTFWTTNYDSLLEDSLSHNGIIPVDIKISQENLATSLPDRQAVVYKMHGDVTDAANAVITKDDYEIYSITHKLFITALQGDLISKTFAFVGFSFEDPNLNYILSRIRVLLGDNKREHFCFLRKINLREYLNRGKTKADYDYDRIKQELRINDLKRYGILTILVEKYSEITDIFNEIKRKYLNKRIFVSGSAREYGEFPDAYQFLNKLGYDLVSAGYKVSTGFVEGVGPQIINGVLNAIYDNNLPLEDYMCIKHLPLINGSSAHIKKASKEMYQRNMISEAGIILFLFGNNYYSNQLLNSKGVLKEFERAKLMKKYIIPVGSTGFAAKQILEEVKANIGRYKYLANYLTVLESETDPEKLCRTIFEILDSVGKS